MELLLLISTSTACIIITELIKRKFSLSANITRRIVHVVTAVVAAVAPLFVSKEPIVIISFIFAVALLVSRSRGLLSSIHSVERKTFGEVWLPLGIGITALTFLPDSVHAFQYGVLILGISDPLAGLFGDLLGRRKIAFLNTSKTIEGSVAFFLSATIITFLFAPHLSLDLILIPLLLTGTEFALIYGLDNLILPIVAAFLLQLLS